MNDSTWDDLPKPWSIVQCCDRYVMGDRIGLRALSKVSGVSFSVLGRESKEGSWANQRAEFNAKTTDRLMDIVASQMATEQAKILMKHYAAEWAVFETGEDLVTVIRNNVQSIGNRLDELEAVESEGGEAPKRPSVYEIQAITASLNLAQNALSSAIDGQRKALGLDYSDINYAVSAVRRAGYEVVQKDEFEAFKRYLEAQSSQSPDFSGDAVEVSTL